MDIIFATNNANKILEIKKVLNAQYHITGLQEAGISIDIPEPHDTLQENAREKAITIFNLTGKNCFSEDTGLLVDELYGAPGVKSARYAGEHANSEQNIDKLLKALGDAENRKAHFKTIICLIVDGKEYYFEGICNGKIISELRGTDGFGYDPVFVPDGSNKTFAEMDIEEKNKYSHRKKAVEKMIQFLNSTHAC